MCQTLYIMYLSLSLHLSLSVCVFAMQTCERYNRIMKCIVFGVYAFLYLEIWRDRLRKITRIKYVPVTQSISIEFKWNVETANECWKKKRDEKHLVRSQAWHTNRNTNCWNCYACAMLWNKLGFFLLGGKIGIIRYDTSRDDLDFILVHSSIWVYLLCAQSFFSSIEHEIAVKVPHCRRLFEKSFVIKNGHFGVCWSISAMTIIVCVSQPTFSFFRQIEKIKHRKYKKMANTILIFLDNSCLFCFIGKKNLTRQLITFYCVFQDCFTDKIWYELLVNNRQKCTHTHKHIIAIFYTFHLSAVAAAAAAYFSHWMNYMFFYLLIKY